MLKPWQKLLLAVAGAATTSFLVRHFELLDWVVHSAERARGLGFQGGLMGVGVIVAATLLLLPLNPLIILAGWVWGWWGVPVVIAGAVVSAAIAFLLARALGQSALAQALRGHPKMEQVVALAERGGALTVALLRVSLLVPFTPGNVALGLTRLPLRALVIGTLAGMAVTGSAFVSMGMLLPDADAIRRGDFLPPGRSLAMAGAGLVLLLGLGAFVARRLNRPSDS